MSEASRPFVCVKFSPVGRTRRFLLPETDLDRPPEAGDRVIVSDGEHESAATLVSDRWPATRAPAPPAGHVVVRRSSPDDASRWVSQKRREHDAYRVAMLKIRERGLPMKLVRVEQPFDGSALTFFFTADSRVDFRQLVRELAAEFSCRIEMRQIGPRDEAQMLGGYGSCGRPLCCTTWLDAFEPISIKMAKRQKLSLSPSRLSGLCGRLKCCLRYELPSAAGEAFDGSGHERRGGCAGGCRSGRSGCAGCGGCGDGGRGAAGAS